MVQISNFLDHPYTLKKGTHIANFSILTPEQTKHIRPVNPTSVRHLLNNSHDAAIHYINGLLKTPKLTKSTRPTGSQHHKIRQRKGTHAHSDTYSQRITGTRTIRKIKPIKKYQLSKPISIQFRLDRFYFTTGSQTSR